MRTMLVLHVMVLCAFGCKGAAQKETAEADRRNMKGWELYCRKEGEAVDYVLLPGTNRLKSVAEVDEAPRTTDVASLLETLAPGEIVMCRVPPDAPESTAYFVPWSNSDLGRSLQRRAERAGIEIHLQNW